MQSSGGLTEAHAFQGKDAILSGPAGGIVGMVRTAELGLARDGGEPLQVIGFDMGGTSTDVCHYAGEFERAFETQVAGVRVRAPMMAIHTVAAGGGSILAFDGARFRVGPESAGANPGPACYRRGGPLTVTDANVRSARSSRRSSRACSGRAATSRSTPTSSPQRFAALAGEIAAATGTERTPEAVAAGFVDIAVGSMANAIKKISVARGYDVTRYTLQCFGGAGGQHACLVADALGMARVFIHPLAGVLSAYGMGLADQSGDAPGARSSSRSPARSADVAARARRARRRRPRPSSSAQGVARGADRRAPPRPPALRGHRLGARRRRSPTRAELQAAFEAAYRQRFAFLMQRAPPDRRGGLGRGGRRRRRGRARPRHPLAAPGRRRVAATVRMFSDGRWHDAALVDRARARGPGRRSPARRSSSSATRRRSSSPAGRPRHRARPPAPRADDAARRAPRAIGTSVDPVMLEVFNNLFMNIAEQMGLQLQNTAYSVNIKERLDFSCALFDADGNLIANAPHMPVHLGSMGESIKTVIARNAGRDEAAATSTCSTTRTTAARTCPTSRWSRRSTSRHGDATMPTFYVGSRGHHADIGGTTPGSMPPFSTRIEEEGVQFDNVKLVERRALPRGRDARAARERRAWPSRNPAQNIADLKAQVAANEKGARELRRDGRAVRPRRRAELHAARAGQRRGVGAPRHHAAEGRRLHAAARQRRARSASRSASTPRARSAEIDFTGTSRAARRTTSTRRPRSAWPRCSTSSARWSTTTSRSTPAA